MKFAVSAALLSLASLVSATVLPRQGCSEAERFGVLTVSSPTGATSFNAGDPVTLNVSFTCAINFFGIVPTFMDYAIVVPDASNNGHEPPTVLAHGRTLPPGALSDEFTTAIPYGFFFAGAPYSVSFTNTYPINGTNGSPVLIQGSVSAGITINA